MAKPFGPSYVVRIVGSKRNATGPTLSADELRMYFCASTEDGLKRGIYFTARTSIADSFEAPTIVPSLPIQEHLDNDIDLSADERTIYYSIREPGINGGGTIHASSRASLVEDFKDDPLATAGLEEGAYPNWRSSPYLSAADKRLYYSNFRYPGSGQPLALLSQTWNGQRWEDETLEGNTACTVVSPDELTAYCGRGIMVTRGSRDELFVPVAKSNELRDMGAASWLSPNGCRIYGMDDRLMNGQGEFVVAEKPL